MPDENSTAPPAVEPPDYVSGGKRCNVEKSEWLPSWWVGYGKDEGCQIEGDWTHWVILAAKILRDPATEVVAPNLYRPDLELTDVQENHYTGLSDPTWPSDVEDEADNSA